MPPHVLVLAPTVGFSNPYVVVATIFYPTCVHISLGTDCCSHFSRPITAIIHEIGIVALIERVYPPMIEIPDAKSIVKPPPVVKFALDDTLNVDDISETPNLVYPPTIAIFVFAAISADPSLTLVPTVTTAFGTEIVILPSTRKTPVAVVETEIGIATLPVIGSPTAYPYSQ
jgi:hypothetical protein